MRILFNIGIQNGVGDVIADLVGMSFRHGLGSKVYEEEEARGADASISESCSWHG